MTHSWVVALLVWLIWSVWVSDLCHDVVLLLQDVISNTGKVCPLEIGIEVDLAYTVANGVLELLLGRSRSTVEDKEYWLLKVALDGVLDVLLVLLEKLWVEFDVSWLVDTVHVSETGGNGEVWGDWSEGLVDVEDVLWLSVKRVVVDVRVVNSILLTTGDTDFL